METKILVTGLWMGAAPRTREEATILCTACNYDYSWLFDTPSTLIWADKIILTPFIEGVIDTESYPKKDIVLAKTIKKTIEMARDYDLIEVRDPSRIITAKMFEKIDEEVGFDRHLLGRLYPNQVRIGDEEKVPGQVFVEGQEYCSPFVRSIYASLILAREWNAKCLFQEDVLNYCKYKFGTSLITDPRLVQPPNAFDTIFDSFLPEYEIFPDYVYPNSRENYCGKCEKEKKCSREYLNDLENNLSRYLEIREYDEVGQIKKLISDIISRLEDKKEKVDHDSIIREFKNEERVITRRIRSAFPKINRWSNVALIASIPTVVVGLATGLPMVSLVGASVAGLSETAKEYVKYLESKYKWIGFVNRNISTRQEPKTGEN